MQFQLNTDHNIGGDERVAEVAEQTVTDTLGPLVKRLTRVELHLKDTNAGKGGPDDIRCTLEARPEGLQPHTVHHDGADVVAAIKGAAKKMRAHLDHEFGKLSSRH
ncbi:HPF/RaiA family ribosome-associated protein [Sediminimonas sp.]|jgi:hypothetical protein|uniref:HPF/RaiA family ribosome-associated protein n=1 Tax=Sediminimonas sp. TaxID=2823379 RepID=UPI0025ED2DCC|nr:HPF/RaiA family ribosome-associated protein [Sediminimonas sp.]